MSTSCRTTWLSIPKTVSIVYLLWNYLPALEALTNPYCKWVDWLGAEITIKSGSPCRWNPLDPTSNETYTLLRNFFEEMAAIFTDPYLHLGGDEASFLGRGDGCFVGDVAKTQWLQARNLTPASLWPYFWQRLFSEVMTTAALANKTVSLWEDTGLNLFGGGAPNASLPWDPGRWHHRGSQASKALKVNTPPGTVFNLYTDLSAVLNETAVRGVPAVLSAPYYLDDTILTHQYGGDAKGAVALHRCHGGFYYWINSIWKCFYGVSPDDDVPEALKYNTSLVVGGEACIWGCAVSLARDLARLLTSVLACFAGRGPTGPRSSRRCSHPPLLWLSVCGPVGGVVSPTHAALGVARRVEAACPVPSAG